MGAHDDVEYMVTTANGQRDRYFKDPKEAMVYAMDLAMMTGEATLDVLVWSEEGARAYGGSDAVERYEEDPEASVFERFEVSVNNVGTVP